MVSGCFDKIVRVWNVKSRKVIDWQQTSHYITALSFTSNGERLCVGLVNGDIVIYDTDNGNLENFGNAHHPISSVSKDTCHGNNNNNNHNMGKLTLMTVISCRNTRGKFSNGRKVTGIEFLSFNVVMISTNDSRIRFIDIKVITFVI